MFEAGDGCFGGVSSQDHGGSTRAQIVSLGKVSDFVGPRQLINHRGYLEAAARLHACRHSAQRDEAGLARLPGKLTVRQQSKRPVKKLRLLVRLARRGQGGYLSASLGGREFF